MTWYLLHWTDGDEFLGVTIVAADNSTHALIRTAELNISPGSNDWLPIDPPEEPCPPGGRVDGVYVHRFVRNDQIELMVCANCGIECEGARQPRGQAVIGELSPLRELDDGTSVGWETVADRLLNREQLIQFGIVAPA